jgi:hypothetical protein
MTDQPPPGGEQALAVTLPSSAEVAAMTRAQLIAEGRRLQLHRTGGLTRVRKDELVALVLGRCTELVQNGQQQQGATAVPAAGCDPGQSRSRYGGDTSSYTAPKDRLDFAYRVWLGLEWPRVWMLLVLAGGAAVLFAALGMVAHLLLGAPTVWSTLGGGATGLGASIGTQVGLNRYRNRKGASAQQRRPPERPAGPTGNEHPK